MSKNEKDDLEFVRDQLMEISVASDQMTVNLDHLITYMYKDDEKKSLRKSPQISCTILPEDKQMLNELTLYMINKMGVTITTSEIIRSLIRLGNKRKEELEFDNE